MPKSDDQTDPKAALIEAAILELAEKGWGGLRTRELAQRAGINKGLVHYHFGSMDNLREQAIAMLMDEFVREWATVVIEAPTLYEGMRAIGPSLDSFRVDDPRGVVLMEAMIHVPRDEALEEMIIGVLESYENALRQRIESEMAAGRIAPDTDAEGLASALTAALDGLALHAHMRPNLDLVAATRALSELLEASIGTPPGSE